LVHEVLERVIPVFLESDVILERMLNHIVHLTLQFQKFLGELNWILQKSFIFHYFLPSRLYVGTHFLNDELKSGLHPPEDPEHQRQLIQL